MVTVRTIRKIYRSQAVTEGAGVRLRRAFGFHQAPELDPFLLLDDFHSSDPEDYLSGFPWHPHRGIETITYVLHGRVEHGDSMGNSGEILGGDVQWMTAGSGIIHQEMPKGREDGLLHGFQLWANLPASHKMMDPRYRDIGSDEIPEVELDGGAKVKVICGEAGGCRGPVRDIVTNPAYLDVELPPGVSFRQAFPPGHTVLAYVFEGEGDFGGEALREPGTVALLGDGDEAVVKAGDGGVRFLLVAGRPIGEPVAWYGPIVMNTDEELDLAFEEYRQGTFLKHRKG